jgi:hypothetical protein
MSTVKATANTNWRSAELSVVRLKSAAILWAHQQAVADVSAEPAALRE